MSYKVYPIGVVQSQIKDTVDYDWGDVVSEIIIDESYKDGLKGLKTFSHCSVVYFLHKAKFKLEEDIERRPQGREDMPLIGIFSQRAKSRPNPIGITSVEILEVNNNVITVKGLDAIDGTPVLDIKPYYPAYDKKEAKTPVWVDKLMEDYF
ncbi:MAG: tRNA (N6-threonylcarbamoyladenosine(37)-N6)-methyltransferase TrmO [Clostridium sp.]